MGQLTTPEAGDERFDPLELRDGASLNRLTLMAGHGEGGDVAGRLAYDVLGAHVLRLLERDDAVKAAGEGLAVLLVTLFDDGTAGAQGWSEWRRAYLTHWRSIRRVWIGGGVAEWLGAQMVTTAQTTLERLGVTGREIALAPEPEWLSLRGAGYDQSLPDGAVALLDFGHSRVKRALADVRAGSPVTLAVLPAHDVGLHEATASADDVRAFMSSAIADVVGATDGEGPLDIGVSVANYVIDGRIVPDDHGLYAGIGADAPERLTHSVERATERRVRIRFVHDGTAAARAVPRSPDAAVIMMGTALGSGFPPPST